MQTLSQRQQEFSKNVGKLIDEIYRQGYSVTLGECFRPPEMAQIDAKDGKGIVDSLHCKRLAIDINLFNPQGVYLSNTEDYKVFGVYWESLNIANEWGGHFTSGPRAHADGNHFQMNEVD